MHSNLQCLHLLRLSEITTACLTTSHAKLFLISTTSSKLWTKKTMPSLNQSNLGSLRVKFMLTLSKIRKKMNVLLYSMTKLTRLRSLLNVKSCIKIAKIHPRKIFKSNTTSPITSSKWSSSCLPKKSCKLYPRARRDKHPSRRTASFRSKFTKPMITDSSCSYLTKAPLARFIRHKSTHRSLKVRSIVISTTSLWQVLRIQFSQTKVWVISFRWET
jgi:hypothetical protein